MPVKPFDKTNLRYLIYILVLLPLFALRDFTPANELKYISIIEEALRNGTWFTFYNQGEIYADKPPLYFWLLMLSRWLTGGYHMWMMGLFSLVPAAGTLWIMDRWMARTNTDHNPIVSNLMLLTCGMFLGSALVLRMDMMMTFFITLSIYTFFKIYSHTDRPRDRYLLPVWIFMAIFSKGAMGLLVPVVSIAVFLLTRGRIREIGKYLGWRQWGILLALCGVWFAGIYAEGGGEYLNNILFKQTVGRGVNSFHHKEPFWFYVPRVLLTFAPWSLLMAVLLWKGLRKKMLINDTVKLYFTVVWTNFLLMSLISSKIDIYLLPIYPFVVYLSSYFLTRFQRSKMVRVALGIPAVIFFLAGPLFLAIRGRLPFETELNVMTVLPLLILTISAALSTLLIFRGRIAYAIGYLGSGLLLTIFTASFSLPSYNKYLGFRTIATQARSYAETNGISTYGYYRFFSAPNMDVFLGQPLDYIGSIPRMDSLDSQAVRTVVFIRDKDVIRDPELTLWLTGHQEMGRTGKYSWIVLGGRGQLYDSTE